MPRIKDIPLVDPPLGTDFLAVDGASGSGRILISDLVDLAVAAVPAPPTPETSVHSKWDELGVSQFTLLYATPGLTPAISFQTVNSRKCIRVQVGGTYSGVHGFVAYRFGPANAPARGRIEFSAYKSAVISGSDHVVVGPLVCANGSGASLRGIVAGVGHDNAPSSVYYVIQGGAISLATPGAGGYGAQLNAAIKTKFEVEYECVTPVVSSPKYTIDSRFRSPEYAYGVGGDVHDESKQATAGLTFSGWNTLPLDTVGFAVVFGTPNGAGSNRIDIADFIVRKHPMDL